MVVAMNAPAYEAPAIVSSSSVAPGYHSHAIVPTEPGCVWSCWSCGCVRFYDAEPPAALYAFRLDGTWGRVTEGLAAQLHPPQCSPIPTCARCEHEAQATIDATAAALRVAAAIASES
jgi:hypothetical protein